MELGFNLNLEQKQKLVMTPQLQIAIELLQYSSHELEDYVDEELKNNPLLEKDENNKNELEKRILNQYSHNYQYNNSGNDDEYNYENFICYEPNLIEHLETQLFQVLDDDEIEIGRYIVGNLDEDGFLTLSVENISQNINETPEKINSVLRRVQILDPVGVAARNLQETLLIQLHSLVDERNQLAEKIILNFFNEVAERNYRKICNNIKEKKESILEAINMIKGLNPRPAAAFKKGKKTNYILPDIIVKQIKGDYVVIMNDMASPILRINPKYYKLLQETEGDDTYNYLHKKFKSALWLIKSIEQRRITIYRIVKSIVEMQRDFFDNGIKHLYSMTMQDIADKISMHESTVSRATNDKYVQTPQGLFELKFFFSSGVDNTSSISIKAMISEFIVAENKSSPYSDQQISELLYEREGIDLSRRTVAKYRKEIDLPSSLQRKIKK